MNTHADQIKARLLNGPKPRSAWDRGVMAYAIELLTMQCDDVRITEEILLNGADNWKHYSEGGAALIYDGDIAQRLCSPSVRARKKGGEQPPKTDVSWLDLQAQALKVACVLIMRTAQEV